MSDGSGAAALGPGEYAGQVRRALQDLSPGLLEELLEDLDEHLAEVAAEGGGSLESALGPPATYARALRQAADLPEPTADRPNSVHRELQDIVERLVQHDAVRSVRAFLPELRPGWWVFRAWLAAGALSYLSGYRSFVLPFGPLLALPVLAAMVVLSVRLGRWSQSRTHVEPGQRLIAVGSNVAVSLFALFVLVAVQQQNRGVGYAGPNPPAYGGGSPATLTRADGTPITNIYPYAGSGQPLSGVLLYDQDGRPLDNLFTYRPDGSPVERVVPTGSAPPPANAYPQRQQTAGGGQGAPTEVPQQVPAPPVLSSAAATPTPMPTSTPSPAPGVPPSSGSSASPSPTPGPGTGSAPDTSSLSSARAGR